MEKNKKTCPECQSTIKIVRDNYYCEFCDDYYSVEFINKLNKSYKELDKLGRGEKKDE